MVSLDILCCLTVRHPINMVNLRRRSGHSQTTSKTTKDIFLLRRMGWLIVSHYGKGFTLNARQYELLAHAFLSDRPLNERETKGFGPKQLQAAVRDREKADG